MTDKRKEVGMIILGFEIGMNVKGMTPIAQKEEGVIKK